MGLYEIMFIIRPDLETEEHEEILNGLENTITGNGGLVDKIVDWRRRRLAYEIEKHVEGHYYLVYFKGQGTIIPEIEHFFKVSDALLRFIIVRVEADYYEAASVEEPVEEEVAETEESAAEEGAVALEAAAGAEEVKTAGEAEEAASGAAEAESPDPDRANAEAGPETGETTESEGGQPSEEAEKE